MSARAVESPELLVGRMLAHGRRDPVWFAENVIGGKLWKTQQNILRGVACKPNIRMAVKACHASGKTHIAAKLVLTFFFLNPGCRIITTAPTWTGVKKLLWAEIRSAYSRLPIGMGAQLLETELKAGPDWYAMGLSTDEGVKFQGHHAEKVLLIFDEAPGVAAQIWEATEGIRAGGDVRMLAIGNPVIASGPFYDAFHEQRANWETVTISAFDTPNFDGVTLESLLEMSLEELADNPYPYLVTKSWVREKYDEWGPEHPLWESRVVGNFPLQAEDALLSLTWLEQAKLRDTPPSGKLSAGLDVAGPGEDETVLCVRGGPRIVYFKAWSNRDPRGVVVAALTPFKNALEKVNVDSVGIGYGMAQHLKDFGFPVQEVNVGESPRDKEKYANLKAELYWGLRMRAQVGDLAGLLDEKAIAQLTGIRYEHDARGRIVIESKEDARKRGVKSPDRAEAVMLAFGEPQFASQGVYELYQDAAAKVPVVEEIKPLKRPWDRL